MHDYLGKKGIRTSIQYPVPVHQQPHYSDTEKIRPLPVTEKLAKEVLSLPMYPELSLGEGKTVIGTIKEFYNG